MGDRVPPPYGRVVTGRRIVRPVRLAAGSLALSVLAACGGGGSAAKAPSTTVDRAAAQAALATKVLTPADLATGDVLDAGWAVGNVSDGVDIKLPACVQEAAGAGSVASARSDLVTKTNLKLPAIQEQLSSYAGDGAAKAFAAAQARLDGCKPTFVFQGSPAAGQIQRISLPVPGATSTAWRTTVTIAGTQVALTSIHIEKGDLEVGLVHVDLGHPDPAVLTGLATKALAKLG
jgi:hypothetical protein